MYDFKARCLRYKLIPLNLRDGRNLDTLDRPMSLHAFERFWARFNKAAVCSTLYTINLQRGVPIPRKCRMADARLPENKYLNPLLICKQACGFRG